MRCRFLLTLACAVLALGSLRAQAPGAQASSPQAGTPSDYILLTVFLKHDQSKTLEEINAELDASKFWARFPPEGIQVESWYVMMGIGQVVTIRVPPARLREVNRAVEQTAWKAFRTEFYPTYDLWPVVQDLRKQALQK